MAKSCILYPEVNGEPSKLYKELLKKIKNRPLVNYLYAAYITSDVADKMDNSGFKRNEQGQHQSKDVLNFLDWDKMQNDIGSFGFAEKQVGAIDSNKNIIDYTNAKDALDKADKFNDTHTGLVATVVQHGDIYNIIVAEKNANTQDYSIGVKQRLKVWEVYKQTFKAIGIDIDNMPSDLATIFSAYNTNIVQRLLNFNFLRINDIYKIDALTLFSVNTNLPQIQKLVQEFGSLENAAQFIDDVNRGIKVPNARQKTLLLNAVNEAKKFKGLDLDALKKQVDDMMQNVGDNSPEEAIRDTLHKLNKKYKIGINEIHKINDNINTLSDAATEALFVMQRQVRQLEKEKGNNAEGRRKLQIVNQLHKEINSKKYYLGITKFLGEAGKQVAEIDNLLNSLPQTGTELGKAFETAKILQKIDSIMTQYYNLVNALSSDNLVIDESISQSDINNIKQTAKKLKEYMDKKFAMINDPDKGPAIQVMITIMLQIVGSETPDGQAIVNALKMAAADTSKINMLYSIGRSSNAVIGAMGSIIRNAQDERNGILNDMSNRIRRATTKLYKSGSNSEFMYEDDGHIISDIDWNLYKNARKAEIKRLYKQGLRGFDLKQAIEDWEDANTEDRVVDKTNGRTEKVPNSDFRKPFPQLTSAQQEYYDTMMQLKGEIGSLLPIYAQHQYLPPQLRRSMMDALGHARSVSDVWKAVRNKAENLVTVREDDENYAMNGIIDGDEYHIAEGDFDNTPLKQIPIFFIKKLSDGDELLKNFSSAIEALAGTAINYDAMNNIVDVVEFIGNFAKGQSARSDMKEADIIEDAQGRVIKDLRKEGRNTNTEKIIDGFINQYVYGKYRDNSGGKTFNKLIDSIVQYTSFKGLATNVKGAFANYIMGEFQMMVEAGAGEFYNFKDYAWAHSKLFGSAGVTGEMWDALNETRNSKSKLFCDMFDPESDSFDSKSHQKYHKSMFRKLMAHDLSFIGYGSGEYLIHYVNMYAILHHQKVKLNGRQIPLYDAFEVVNRKDGAGELRLKNGVTRIDGSTITPEFIQGVKQKVRYVNQTCHGAMNKEDKGIIYQKWYGRLAMNFRQWMVEHYSRRFRGMHFDYSLGMNREGYWVSVYKLLENDKSRETREQGERLKALGYWLRDAVTFNWRARTNWSNLSEMQKYNCKRAGSEFLMLISLLGLSLVLGEPDEHKKEFWRRWWIYQTRRMIMDTEASMPNPKMLDSVISIMNSPFGGVQTISSLMYLITGLYNGDLWTTIKLGDHKGENRYLRNVKKYLLPFFKDYEQMQKMDTDDNIFKVFDTNPTNR